MEEIKQAGLDAKRRVVLAVTTVMVMMGFGGVASAASHDPLGGAGDTLFSTLTGYLTGTLVPAIIGLALVGIAIGLLLKWGKKAVKST